MTEPSERWRSPGLHRRDLLRGLAAVGGFLAADFGALLCANNCNGSELSKAAVFRPGRTGVVGRFSLTGGNPRVADAPAAARGLGLAFGFPNAQQWRMAMLNLPVFLDRSPQGFYDRLIASAAVPGTGKPDPAAMSRFLAAHPETARAMKILKEHPPTPGFADSTYRGLHAFYFVHDSGPADTGAVVPATDATGPAAVVGSQRVVRCADPPTPVSTTALEYDADRRPAIGSGARPDNAVAG
jgi:Catalase